MASAVPVSVRRTPVCIRQRQQRQRRLLWRIRRNSVVVVGSQVQMLRGWFWLPFSLLDQPCTLSQAPRRCVPHRACSRGAPVRQDRISEFRPSRRRNLLFDRGKRLLLVRAVRHHTPPVWILLVPVFRRRSEGLLGHGPTSTCLQTLRRHGSKEPLCSQ